MTCEIETLVEGRNYEINVRWGDGARQTRRGRLTGIWKSRCGMHEKGAFAFQDLAPMGGILTLRRKHITGVKEIRL
ncbi:MAG: hypothetical protein M0Z52_07445 [Actinomycetota bacterium]|nr:hypothetical protein [Actinomycetota bacterium]